MAKPLVIVESPAKARTIAGYLGKDFEVLASVGHIRDLPRDKKELQEHHPDKVETHGRLAGIDPDDHFDAAYVVHDTKKKVVADLKRALKGADELIVATDEDREGEAIGWHVLEVLQPKVPVRRMVFHEITPHAIREALDQPRDLDMKLVEAQEGRRVLDRLVGWETSPVLWRVFGRGQAASAGRVQSVAVRLIVERERARMAFRTGRWNDLEAELLAHDQGFRASLVEVDGRRVAEGRDFDPATGQIAARSRRRAARPAGRGRAGGPAARRPVRGRVGRGGALHRATPGAVHHVDPAAGGQPEAALRRRPNDGDRAAPLRARIHHLHAHRLDEPVGSGDHRRPHRDQPAVRRRVPARRAARLPQQGQERAGGARGDPSRGRRDPFARRAARRARRRRAAALRARVDPYGRVPDGRRARQQDDVAHRGDVVGPVIGNRRAPCSAPRARRTTSSGGAASTSKTSTRATWWKTRRACLQSSKGEAVACTGLDAVAHETKPPARYTEASLVKELEERGIGRPSTYAAVIETIQARNYAWKKGTALGARVDRVRGHQPARAPLRPPRRLQLHGDHGRGARRHRAR